MRLSFVSERNYSTGGASEKGAGCRQARNGAGSRLPCILLKSLCPPVFPRKKISTGKGEENPPSLWILFITHSAVRSSAIFTTFPAPIVINRSPFTQFFCKNASISENVSKAYALRPAFTRRSRMSVEWMP